MNVMTYRYHRSKEMAECVSEVLKGKFQSHLKQDQQLFLHWRKIVGEEYANLAVPQKISRGKGGQACLILGVKTSASSVMLNHVSVQLIETINGYFGYKVIDRLQFEPYRKVPMPVPYRKPALPLPSMRLTDDIKASLHQLEDGPLKDVLKRLGKTLETRTRKS